MCWNVPMISGTSESLRHAGEAFQGCILLAQLLRSMYPYSDWVAVQHLFLSLPATLLSFYVLSLICIAQFYRLKVCFIWYNY